MLLCNADWVVDVSSWWREMCLGPPQILISHHCCSGCSGDCPMSALRGDVIDVRKNEIDDEMLLHRILDE